MTTINIRRDIKDSFYRYKMPKLISKVEGKGNGIKTVIPNMPEVSKALNRPPSYATKFFGFELGTQVKIVQKNDKYIVNGAHDAEKLQEVLDLFIEKFVLCSDCKNPETDLTVKNQAIISNCQACGKRRNLDTGHKLCTFIIKNPPPAPKKIKTETKVSETTEKEAEDIILNDAAIGEPQKFNESTDDRIKDKSNFMKDESKSDEEPKEDTDYDKFAQTLEANPNMNDNEIISLAKKLGIVDNYRTVHIIVQIIFNENITAQLTKRKKLLKKLVFSEKHQKYLLGGLERLIGLKHPDLLEKFPQILTILYDEDICEEEPILKWGSKPSKQFVDRKISQKVKSHAEPFMNWLKEAEEESEEE